ncbi:MAG: type II toxin-antitoxin system death-on-curing family toxin [Deltaproteobacteria bacterium]|nr:MAG: type II toxin-antitoxin system death-on-curing family toxin [Deltaproteobacteria bacterium]
MRYLALNEVLALHGQVMAQSGGAVGILNLPALESALAQPRMTFGGDDLYLTLVEKAAALGYSLSQNHPFVDGNKRTGHAAMEVFLVLNGFEIQAAVDEQERVMLQVAAGEMTREEFTDWLRAHVVAKA